LREQPQARPNRLDSLSARLFSPGLPSMLTVEATGALNGYFQRFPISDSEWNVNHRNVTGGDSRCQQILDHHKRNIVWRKIVRILGCFSMPRKKELPSSTETPSFECRYNRVVSCAHFGGSHKLQFSVSSCMRIQSFAAFVLAFA